MALAPATPNHPMQSINAVVRPDGALVHLDDIATVAEGEALLDEIDEAILSMEGQIQAAASGRNQHDPDWNRRIGVALKRKRRIRPRLQQRIGELRKAERAAQVRAAAVAAPGDGQRKAFVIAAADVLPHETVTEIWARAKEIRPAAFGEGGAA